METINRLSALGILLIFLLPAVSAQVNIPFFDESKMQQTGILLDGDFQPVREALDPNAALLLVEGSNLNAIERTLLPYVKQRYPAIGKVRTTPEATVTLQTILDEQRMVVLIGGPSQNALTAAAVGTLSLQERQHPSQQFLAIYEGKNHEGATVMVLSDQRGFGNLPRLGPSRSPLAKYMSIPAVIATAPALSVFLMWLWNLIGGPLRVIAARIITTRKAQKAKVKAAERFFSIGAFQMKYREVGAILLAAAVYATAATIAVIGFGVPLMQALRINLIGGIAFYGIREAARLLMSHKMGLHTEYIFWLPGAIFGILSGWLGNTLNTPGYVKSYKEADFDKTTLMRYAITVGTFVLAVSFLILNLLVPTIGKQLFGIIASTYAAIEMLPVRPCPGRDIFKWKPWLFILTFLIVWPVYILFNFIL